jgi:hypothetical protein
VADYLTIHQLMCSRLHLAALSGLLLAAFQTPKAETRSSTMQVRVTVVRACSIDTRGAGESETVALTCTSATSANVATTGSGRNARVVPLPTRQTTVVAAPPAVQHASSSATTRAGTAVRQIVTVNF